MNGPITDDVLVSIWLDGYATGTASAALRMVADATFEDAGSFSNEMVQQAIDDPAVIETIRDQIRQRLTGIHTGPTILSPCIIQPRKEY